MPPLGNILRIAYLGALSLSSCAASPTPPAPSAPAPSAPPAVSPPIVTALTGQAPTPPAPPALGPDATRYADTARRIREASLASDGAFEKLRYLTDRIGARL